MKLRHTVNFRMSIVVNNILLLWDDDRAMEQPMAAMVNVQLGGRQCSLLGYWLVRERERVNPVLAHAIR